MEMGGKKTDAGRLCSAIIKPKTRKLAETIQRRFEAKLEGIQLPEDPARRKTFIECACEIFKNLGGQFWIERSERMAELNAPDNILEGNLEILEKKLDRLREIIDICRNSSGQMDYLQFIGRFNFNIHFFLSSVGLFAEDRKPVFSDVPEEKKAVGMEMLRLIKDGSRDALNKLISILERETSGRDGQSTWDLDISELEATIAITLWKDDEEVWEAMAEQSPKKTSELLDFFETYGGADTIKNPEVTNMFLSEYGIYLCIDEKLNGKLLTFDKLFRKGVLNCYLINPEDVVQQTDTTAEMTAYLIAGGWVSHSDILLISHEGMAADDSMLQHKLQLLFDELVDIGGNPLNREIRAFLAALAFSEETGAALQELHKLASLPPIGQNYAEATDWALDRIRHLDSAKQIKETARKLLNEEYRKACGLTYDEILEPFRKDLNP